VQHSEAVMPRLITSRWMRENQFATWFSHEE